MNYKLLNTLFVMILIMGCTKPNIVTQNFNTEHTIHYSQIKDIENISGYIIYLNEGDKIPINITLDSELLDIDNKEINLILKQKLYLRMEIPESMYDEIKSSLSEEDKQQLSKNIMIYLSPNAENWASYTDIKAVEQLFGIKGGSLSFGMGIAREDGIKISLLVKTNSI